MKDALVAFRNFIWRLKYKWFWKPIFFQFDPEWIHDRMCDLLLFCSRFALLRGLTRLFFGYSHPILGQNVLGIHFENPVGLSAGFDKNALLTDIMSPLGFGFEEVGSITGEPCAGNPKPRLWRLKKWGALQVYYGLKNDGCEAVSTRLRRQKLPLPVGINIAKTNSPDTASDDAAIADYFKAYRAFEGIGAYTTINISCPNAFGGQSFHDRNKLDALLAKITSLPKTKPIFLKISPDLSDSELDAVIAGVEKYDLDGFVCTNLTKDLENWRTSGLPGQGGLSGRAVAGLSLRTIRYIYGKTRGKFVIIGVGGIFTAEDAYERIKAGATLLELITGMIFEGPQAISSINLGLVKLLKRDGYKNISEAVGTESTL